MNTAYAPFVGPVTVTLSTPAISSNLFAPSAAQTRGIRFRYPIALFTSPVLIENCFLPRSRAGSMIFFLQRLLRSSAKVISYPLCVAPAPTVAGAKLGLFDFPPSGCTRQQVHAVVGRLQSRGADQVSQQTVSLAWQLGQARWVSLMENSAYENTD